MKGLIGFLVVLFLSIGVLPYQALAGDILVQEPVDQSEVSGKIDLVGRAWGNIFKRNVITRAEFIVNGDKSLGLVARANDRWWRQFELKDFDTSPYAGQMISIEAIVFSGSGDSQKSPPVYVKVLSDQPPQDTTKPVVAISDPQNNATVSGSILLTATASDNVGVSYVEFFVNGISINTDNTVPYNKTWDSSSIEFGSVTVQAKAYDAAGNVGDSTAITLNADNRPTDTEPPTVSVIKPAVGDAISGSVQLEAAANDNAGIAWVHFYVNGENVGSDYTSRYNALWDSAGFSGTATFQYKAIDTSGNETWSAPVSIEVGGPPQDTTPPVVAMISPIANQMISGTFTLKANATDDVGVTSVEFFVNGASVGSDTSVPFEFNWDSTGISYGDGNIRAMARDAAGNSTQSALVAVIINNQPTETGPEVCDGVDNDGDGAIDNVLGIENFCNRSALHPLVPGNINSTFTEAMLIEKFNEYFNQNYDWLPYTRAYLHRWAGENPCPGKAQPQKRMRTLMGLTSMYLATGQTSYLDEALVVVELMYNASASVDLPGSYDIPRGWGWDPNATDLSGFTACGFDHQSNSMEGISAITEILRAMAERGDHVNPPYSADFQKYYNFAANLVRFYSPRDAAYPGIANYRGFADPLAGKGKLAKFVTACLDLYEASGRQDTSFRDDAIIIINRLEVDGDYGYVKYEGNDFIIGRPAPPKWLEDWGPSPDFLQDTGHENRMGDVMAALEDSQMHGFFGDGDNLRRITNTFIFRLWESNPDATVTPAVKDCGTCNYYAGDPVSFYPNQYHTWTDGNNDCYQHPWSGTGEQPYWNGEIGYGWHKLGRFDNRIRILLQHLTDGLMNNGAPDRLWGPPCNVGTSSDTMQQQNHNWYTNFIGEALYQMKKANSEI